MYNIDYVACPPFYPNLMLAGCNGDIELIIDIVQAWER
jgi:hypothetical protein